jgi:dTDP-4-amino-4,6-dideoxygalactose transaminase
LPSYLDAVAPQVAALAGRRHAILTSSGSAAIVLALQALGLGPGSRVLVPATTWVGCATAVLRTGATPVFLDAQADSPCAAPVGPPADAILAVHTYGSQVDLAAVRRAWPGVPIVEDCSHCHGAAAPDGTPLGAGGDLAVFSFQASKLLPAGEGGAVLTDDGPTARRLLALATDSRRLRRRPDPSGLNRLEPAGLDHGANHAMSEFAAAVLWAQLQDLPALAAARARGVRVLADALDPDRVRLVHDTASARAGAFYGIPLRPVAVRPGGPEALTRAVWEWCGARLDRVYPPIPASPLYRPATVGAYRAADGGGTNAFPHSWAWHEQAVVLPHQLFLAEDRLLQRLADGLNTPAGRTPAGRRAAAAPAEICVVVLTRGERPSLAAALAGIAGQDYPGPLSVLLVCDGADPAAPDRVRQAVPAPLRDRGRVSTVVLVPDGDPAGFDGIVRRVATLRNSALAHVTAPLVAFLDDDNDWEPDHLSSLAALLTERGALAVHSWRQLLSPVGEPCVPDTFPWIADPPAAARRWAALQRAGVVDGTNVIRDAASISAGPDGELGMVDLGEWLFDRRLFGILGFEAAAGPEPAGAEPLGEDDRLLRRLRDLLLPVHCTHRPTLRYRLGGFSNGWAAVPAVAALGDGW